jgi:hypothetical protein
MRADPMVSIVHIAYCRVKGGKPPGSVTEVSRVTE